MPDSSVLIGLLDPNDGQHQLATESVLTYRAQGVGFSVPTSVLAEVLVAEAKREPAAVELR